MKTFKYSLIITFISAFLSLGCSKEDEEFYNAVYTTIPGLVAIEVQPNYSVDDVIWLNTNAFSRFLSEPNQTTPLDVYQTTNSQKFSFLYSLERKLDNNTWQIVSIGNNFVEDSGTMNIGNYVTANAIYNAASQEYEYRGGLRLTQAGEYRIGFFNSLNGSDLDIISESSNSSTFLTIATTTNNVTNGYYTFTVN